MFKNNSLIKKAKDSKKKEVRQADLKTELDIREKEDVIVVEKSNMIKFFVRTVGTIIMSLCRIIICLLVIVGIAALFYREPRQYLHMRAVDLFIQIQGYIN
jgi:hypothetical protein